jgi:hypothetical protein
MVGFLEALSADDKRHHVEFYTITFLQSDSFMSGHHVVPQFSIVESFHVSGYFLCVAFPGRWIGRVDSVLWRPRSRDFTPLDFLFSGYVTNYVYMDKICDQNHLEARI